MLTRSGWGAIALAITAFVVGRVFGIIELFVLGVGILGALAVAVATIVAWGEDPADYVTTEIRVPESRFTAWPPRIRAVFEPARTVATGRPSYSLEQKDAA